MRFFIETYRTLWASFCLDSFFPLIIIKKMCNATFLFPSMHTHGYINHQILKFLSKSYVFKALWWFFRLHDYVIAAAILSGPPFSSVPPLLSLPSLVEEEHKRAMPGFLLSWDHLPSPAFTCLHLPSPAFIASRSGLPWYSPYLTFTWSSLKQSSIFHLLSSYTLTWKYFVIQYPLVTFTIYWFTYVVLYLIFVYP